MTLPSPQTRVPRRVLLLVLHWNHGGGLEIFTGQLVGMLAELGCQIEVWAAFDAKPAEEAGVRSRAFAPENLWLRRGYVRGWWRVALRRALAREAAGFDLVICGHADLLPALNQFGRQAGRPPCWLWAYGREIWGEPGRRLARWFGAVDRCISISAYTAERLREIDPALRTVVVPCPIDTDYFVPTANPERIRRDEILICGRLSAVDNYKGHTVLFQALPLAEKLCGRPLRVRVVGDGSDRARLERLVQPEVAAGRVTFSGRVSFDQLLAAYQECGVFVLPSRVVQREREHWSGEGFGLVYVEAAACGRPVVASTDGGAPESIRPGETGLLADPRSPEAVAAAIAAIFKDPAAADAMGARGREWALSRFSRAGFRKNLAALLASAGAT